MAAEEKKPQPSEPTEGILCAASRKGTQTKQIKSTMPTFGAAGRILKRPHSINDERQEEGRLLVFSPQRNKTSDDIVAQMFVCALN